MEPYNKKNLQARYGQYGSIMPLTDLLLEVIIIRSSPWYKEDSSPTSWNLSTKFITDPHTLQYLVVRGSKKQQRRGLDSFNFHKRRDFFSLLKNLSAIWVNLTLHPSLILLKQAFLSPSSLAKKRKLIWKKSFMICFIPLYP